MTPAILALDLGTSSTRCALHDARGRRFLETTAQIAYPLRTASDGRAELDPARLERAVQRVVAKTLRTWAAKKSRPRIAAIGVSCFWHSLLGLDARGRPLTPIYTWADSRCRPDALALRRHPGERVLHTRTGCMARASFWPAKLLWLRRTEPALFRRVARWVSPAEWIQQQWCGHATASLSMASGTGLLDARTLRWNTALLLRCGLTPARLNPLSDEPASLAPTAARRFPALARARWYPALGDGAASNLGSGALTPGRAAINVGTSAAIRVIIEHPAGRGGPRAPFGLFAFRLDARRALLGGAVSNAGNLRAWALRELRLPADPARLEKLLAARMAPPPGLVLLPFWMAERAPTWPEDLPSAVFGLTQASTALDLLQALQEATFHRLAQIAGPLERAVRRPLACIVSGGIRHSPESLQRLANVLGRPIHVSDEPEASLRGAACFALERLGHRPPIPKLGPPIRPDPRAARAYRAARERQAQLEKDLRVLYPETRSSNPG